MKNSGTVLISMLFLMTCEGCHICFWSLQWGVMSEMPNKKGMSQVDEDAATQRSRI